MKKIICGILLIAAAAAILFLTFQDSAGTVRLSEGIRLWFEKIGVKSDFHSFRSNAHLVVFFVLGIVLSLFGRECAWSWWAILIVGAGFGLLDEGIKVLLPTREFDMVDLLKDWIGIAAAIGVMRIARRRKTS